LVEKPGWLVLISIAMLCCVHVGPWRLHCLALSSGWVCVICQCLLDVGCYKNTNRIPHIRMGCFWIPAQPDCIVYVPNLTSLWQIVIASLPSKTFASRSRLLLIVLSPTFCYNSLSESSAFRFRSIENQIQYIRYKLTLQNIEWILYDLESGL
jgi:hypothetical protein